MSSRYSPMTRDHDAKPAEITPRHRTCQWIDGHGKGKRFTCSEATIAGSSYCQEHHERCYTRYVPDWLKIVRRAG